MTSGRRKPPSPFHILAIIPIAGLVSIVDALLGGRPFPDLRYSIVASLASAGLLGCPFVFWMLDQDRKGLATSLVIGSLAATLPLPLILTSGIIGRLARGGMPWLKEVMSHGAPIPLAGVVPWPAFIALEIRCIAVGAVSAAIYWALFLRQREAAATTERPAL